LGRRKEGRGGFSLECGVGKEGRRGVLSRIWCLKILGKKEE
jgi:hypothetical protein